MREKDEWRFATMEYGGQCVTTAGTRWMLVWSAHSWDTGIKVYYTQVCDIVCINPGSLQDPQALIISSDLASISMPQPQAIGSLKLRIDLGLGL